MRASPLILRYCAFLLLGALMPLAFAPWFFWPLAIILPALLIWVVGRDSDPRQAFLAGWIFGLGYFGFGVYWIYNSLHDFGMAPPFVAGAITALLIALLAVFPGLALLTHRYSARRFGEKSIWLLPLTWFGFEWLRGWFLTGFPWLSLGYSQTESPLAGYAALVGVYGIGALSMLMSVALVVVVRDRRYGWLMLLVLIPASGYLLGQVNWTQAQTSALKVTMVQGNIPQEIKWQYQQRQNIVDTYWRETSQHWDSDLIIWPETALPGHSEEIDQSILQPLENQAGENDSQILTGLVISDTANDSFYNGLMLLGKERSLYLKRHLVVFGEYYPMRWLLDFLRGFINIPYSDLTAGPSQQELMKIKDTVLGLSICFEDAFSRDVLMALPEANLLVNVSNDAWFGDSTAPHQHLQMAQMRSQETGRAMVRSTNTGVSAFIDYRGKIIAQREQFRTQSISLTLSGRSGVTPFFYFAKVQGALAVFALLVILFLAWRKAV